MISYNPTNWYWVIPGITDEVFSSARREMVPVTDADYVAFLGGGNRPSRLNPALSRPAAFAELHEVLRLQAPAAAAAVAEDWRKAGYLGEEVAPAGTRLALTAEQAEIIAKCVRSTAEEVRGSSAEELVVALALMIAALGQR